MSRKKYKKAVCMILALVLALSCLSGCSGTKYENSVKIGVYEPLSGDQAYYAEDEITGMELARELYPEVLGRPVELVYRDNESTIEGAESAAALLGHDGCSIVLGSCSSTLSIAGSDVFKNAKIPAITATATNPLVTSGNEYYFRACYIDTYQGTTMAKYAFENLGAEKAFVIYNENDDFGATVGDIFASKMKELIKNSKNEGKSQDVSENVKSMINDSTETAAADITSSEDNNVVISRYTDEQNDYTSIMSTIKSFDPDVIFIPSSVEESSELIRQIDEIGFEGVYLGTNVWKGTQMVESLGSLAEGIVFPVVYDENVTYSALSEEFAAKYHEEYGEGEIPDNVALGFDAYMLAYNAIETAGVSDDGTAIKDALLATKEYPGVTGLTTFMWTNNPVKTVVLRTIEEGQPVYCDLMHPTFVDTDE